MSRKNLTSKIKLTVINNQVIIDYSNVNMQANIQDEDYSAAQRVRKFLLETSCRWNNTETPQVKKMAYEPWSGVTEYGNAREFRRLITCCECKAMFYGVEITAEFEELLAATEKRCQELRQAEIDKEKAKERKAEWESKCQYGCGKCKNLCYNVDLPFCKCTGKTLEERNEPIYNRGVLQLFKLVPFPSEGCPYSA